MLRLVITVIAVAGALATGHPASIDPLATVVSARAQAAAAAAEQPALPAPALSWDTPAASGAKAERSKEFIPVGIGWG